MRASGLSFEMVEHSRLGWKCRATGWRLWRESFGGCSRVSQLSPRKLATWLSDSSRDRPQLLDVRTREEFAVSHIPGAGELSRPRALSTSSACWTRTVR